MVKKILLVTMGIVIGFVAGRARVYNGLNSGIAWNTGGIELRGDAGIFLCEANYNPATTEQTFYHWNRYLPESVVESLVTDC